MTKKSKGLDPKIMQNIALVVLVKQMIEAPEGKISLTKEDFLNVDLLRDDDKWTLDMNDDGDVIVELVMNVIRSDS